MALPQVNVTVLVRDSNNVAVVGATVTAKLTAQDRYLGQIVPRDTISGVTDAGGSCVMPLFPNALGEVTGNFCTDNSVRHTSYAFTIKDSAGKTLYKTVATVPNNAVNLTDIAGNVCSGSGASAASSTGNYADGETPTGVIDGANTVFTLAFAPSPPSSLELFLNGALQSSGGVDYTLAGNTITYVNAPQVGDRLICWYRH